MAIRKRNIVLAIAGLELLTLPAAAHIFTDFELPDRTIVVGAEIPMDSADTTSFFVNSDGPFAITAENMPGDAKIMVMLSGTFQGVNFGSAAQMPGPAMTCSRADSAEKTVIYQGSQGTISGEGEVVEQAVLVIVNHPGSAEPVIKFIPQKSAEKYPRGEKCPFQS